MAYFQKNLKYIFESNKDLKNKYLRKLKKNFFQNKKIDIELLYKVVKSINYSFEELFEKDLKEIEKIKHKKIKFLVTDVDGVLTDGGVYINQNQEEGKKFDVKDGFAIRQLTQKGFQVGFLSAGFNRAIVQKRAQMLGVQFVYVGKDPKIDILNQWCEQLKINLDQVAYIGDDFFDLEVIERVGISACPSDAINVIKENVNFVIPRKGGKSAVRYFIDEILSKYI